MASLSDGKYFYKYACVALILFSHYLEAGSADCVLEDLELSLPINRSEWKRSAQDYAEYSSRVNNAYHTGIDFSGIDSLIDVKTNKGPSVLSVADGCIVELQINSNETDDHGWGNTIVIKHVVGGSTYFTQYSHLHDIDVDILNECKSLAARSTQSHTPVDDNAPVITSAATASVFENTTFVLTFNAIDADQPHDALAFSITGGADKALFKKENSINLVFMRAPDFEKPLDADADNNYEVQIGFSDDTSTTTQDIVVTVIDNRITCNEIPVKESDELGHMGGTGKGKEDKWDVHLHLELKNFPSLDEIFGYSCVDPNVMQSKDAAATSSKTKCINRKVKDKGINKNIHYYDPVLFFQSIPKIIPEFDIVVPKEGKDAGLRGGPDKKYVLLSRLVEGEKFTAIREALRSSGCALGWYQIRPKDNDASVGETEGWICRGEEIDKEWVRVDKESSELSGSTTGNIATALIIDRSPSMMELVTNPDGMKVQRLAVAKEAAKAYLYTLDDTDSISISSFSYDSSTELPLERNNVAKMKGEKIFDGYLDLIVVKNATNIDAGLAEGYKQLVKAESEATTKKIALLISDGEHNASNSCCSSTSDYVAEEWQVCTIGFGTKEGEDTLREIAEATGCTYSRADAENLVDTYQRISAYVQNKTVLLNTSDPLPPDQSLEFRFTVNNFSQSFNVYTSWAGSRLKVMLTSPDGKSIDARNISGVKGRFDEGKTFQSIEMLNPKAGEWKVELSWDEPPATTEQVNISVAEKSNIFSRIHGLLPTYEIGHPVNINVDAFEVLENTKVPLVSASASVTIQKPGQEMIRMVQAQSSNWAMYKDVVVDVTREVFLFDDGTHEDYKTGDGIFGGVFTETDKNGAYLVTAKINGKKQNGESVEKTLIGSFQVGPITENQITNSQTLQYMDQAKTHSYKTTPSSNKSNRSPLDAIDELQTDPMDAIDNLLN